jgi:alkylhydroperoxidase family enzyme
MMMARVPYVTREAFPVDQQHLYDRLEAARRKQVENVFKAVANVPALLEGVLGMATALRKSKVLSRKFRELVIVTVGIETGSEYEVNHHWNDAIKAGVSREQLARLSDFEAAPCFNEAERAVIRYAREATLNGEVRDTTWDAVCKVLNLSERMELVLSVAWYNCVVRILLPLRIETEDWYRRL